MEKLTFTKEQFKKAKRSALEEIINEPKLEGMAGLAGAMAGMIFADKMEKHLFTETENTEAVATCDNVENDKTEVKE